jgi:nucleoside-diphosphate-sugar epimerase
MAAPVMNLIDERVLLLGASGWFGREFLASIRCGDIYCVGSHKRQEQVEGLSIHINEYNFDIFREFDPTVVIDCAGLNRHRQYKSTFLSECLDLTLNYMRAMSLPNVKAGLTFSSGAAGFNPLGHEFDDYSASKILHENLVKETLAPSVVMRCFAVSGRLCLERKGYAMSNFIDMAKKGKIKITAERPTHRRYMAIDDYLRCGIAELGQRITLDSSGVWVELSDLAHMIAEKTGAKVQRPLKGGMPTQYGSNDQRCYRIAQRDGWKIKNLSEQIDALL